MIACSAARNSNIRAPLWVINERRSKDEGPLSTCAVTRRLSQSIWARLTEVRNGATAGIVGLQLHRQLGAETGRSPNPARTDHGVSSLEADGNTRRSRRLVASVVRSHSGCCPPRAWLSNGLPLVSEAMAASPTAPFALEPAWPRARRRDKARPCGPAAALSPGYLPVSTSACSIVGCALHVPHSGALSQIVPKSWLE